MSLTQSPLALRKTSIRATTKLTHSIRTRTFFARRSDNDADNEFDEFGFEPDQTTFNVADLVSNHPSVASGNNSADNNKPKLDLTHPGFFFFDKNWTNSTSPYLTSYTKNHDVTAHHPSANMVSILLGANLPIGTAIAVYGFGSKKSFMQQNFCKLSDSVATLEIDGAKALYSLGGGKRVDENAENAANFSNSNSNSNNERRVSGGGRTSRNSNGGSGRTSRNSNGGSDLHDELAMFTSQAPTHLLKNAPIFDPLPPPPNSSSSSKFVFSHVLNAIESVYSDFGNPKKRGPLAPSHSHDVCGGWCPAENNYSKSSNSGDQFYLNHPNALVRRASYIGIRIRDRFFHQQHFGEAKTNDDRTIPPLLNLVIHSIDSPSLLGCHSPQLFLHPLAALLHSSRGGIRLACR